MDFLSISQVQLRKEGRKEKHSFSLYVNVIEFLKPARKSRLISNPSPLANLFSSPSLFLSPLSFFSLLLPDFFSQVTLDSLVELQGPSFTLILHQILILLNGRQLRCDCVRNPPSSHCFILISQMSHSPYICELQPQPKLLSSLLLLDTLLLHSAHWVFTVPANIVPSGTFLSCLFLSLPQGNGPTSSNITPFQNGQTQFRKHGYCTILAGSLYFCILRESMATALPLQNCTFFLCIVLIHISDICSLFWSREVSK